MPPEKIDSLADDVKPLVLGLLRQISGLTARVDELLAQNKALLARIAELEAERGKPPKTPDNSSLPPSRGHVRQHAGLPVQARRIFAAPSRSGPWRPYIRVKMSRRASWPPRRNLLRLRTSATP